MTHATHDLLAAFGAVEDDQRYTRLVDNFADDAIYFDPFFGPQIGKPAIREFMEHMEVVVPASGATFTDWRVAAAENCGYAEWAMVATSPAGVAVPVLGESLYRVRDGQVLGVVDYVDPVAYNKLRGDSARTPKFLAGNGCLPGATTASGPIAAELRNHVESMSCAGRWPGSAELIDVAGDGDSETGVGWAQWIFHGLNGDFAGWSLRRPGGAIRDLFDTVTAYEQSLQEGTP